MTQKILYIGDNPIKTKSGGDWVNQRNILALKELYKENLHIYPIKCENKIFTFINLLNRYMLGLSFYKAKQILAYIKKNKITEVFLASSKYGKLAQLIKKKYPNIKIYIFFHNIEKQYTEEEYKVNPNWKNKIITKVTAFNEDLSCQFAEKLIVLNQRDNLLLDKYYKKEAHIILPTTFIDKYDPLKAKNENVNKQFILLFVGFAFFANIEGIKWFIDSVMPSLQNCKLQIVGNGMDKIFKSSKNIEVHGFVEDLASFYYNCDIVVLPILSGGGMKTKTAEALMYGCPIVGTKEAFEGYELDYNKIGGIANSSEEMIAQISNLMSKKEELYHKKKYARYIFKKKYSFENTIVSLKNLYK